MPYRIALVDDKPYMLKTLRAELTDSGLATISLTANNGEHFLQQLEGLSPDQYPEVVLMDIDMPVMNGIQAVRIGSIKYPSILYIMLTVFDDDDKLFEALRAGAHGYLLKEERTEVILRSVEEVVEKKGAPMSPRIARKTLQMLLNDAPTNADQNIENSGLSVREIEILQSMVAGLDYKQIGEKLFISPNTVRNHISRIYDKLHITSKAEAIKLAIKNKWTG